MKTRHNTQPTSMPMQCDGDTSVTDWVIEHPAALQLFRELGIDYCCGGKSLETACHEQRLDSQEVLSQLRSLLRGEA